MSSILSPGRWRGLQTTSNAQQIFTIMAFDQRGSYEKMLPKDFAYETAVSIKQAVVTSLSPYTSAVLLDATYGLGAAQHMAGTSGILLALEKTGYTGQSTYRHTEFDPQWTVAKIKKFGASAVKLLVYYHPDSGELATEIENLARDVADTCHEHDLPLFVEPVSYSLDANIPKDSPEFAQTRPYVVRETARRLAATGADVLKLEFPVDAKHNSDSAEWKTACEAVSEIATVPWVLLSAGVDFPIFARQVEIACRAGASGFLGGRAIWKECIAMSPAERQTFLETTARERLQNLTELANAYGRPWTDYYAPLPTTEDWFAHYN
jgi:tagatose 1,6-diphosphate aldolase